MKVSDYIIATEVAIRISCDCQKKNIIKQAVCLKCGGKGYIEGFIDLKTLKQMLEKVK